MGSKTKTRYCGCGAVLSRCRKQCDACNEVAVKLHNAKVTERRQQGLIPRSNGVRKGEQPAYEQIEVYKPCVPKPKRVISEKERERLDTEARKSAAEYDRRCMERFGLRARPGKPLASGGDFVYTRRDSRGRRKVSAAV